MQPRRATRRADVQVRRQLEYQIYRDSHPEIYGPADGANATSTATKVRAPAAPAGAAAAPASIPPAGAVPPKKPPAFVPPSTMQAVRLIVDKMGPLGLWTGFKLHFVRDTMGTALYFAEYDVMRYWLGRKGGDGLSGVSGEQGELPAWARGWLPVSLVPFVCGSLAGVTSWALIYPVDVSDPSLRNIQPSETSWNAVLVAKLTPRPSRQKRSSARCPRCRHGRR